MKKKKHSPRQDGKIKAKGMNRLGVQLSSYNHGFSKLPKENKASSIPDKNHRKNDDRAYRKSDEASLESTSPKAADKRTCDDNSLTEPSTETERGR